MHNLIWILVTIFSMTGFLSYILVHINRNMRSFTFRQYSVSVLVLAMMASMLNSIVFFLDTSGNFFDAVVAVNISMVEMTGAILFLLWKVFTGKHAGTGGNFALLVASLVLWNEISMGMLLFSLAQPALIAGYAGSALSFIPFFVGSSVDTYLFILPMASEMAILLVLFHRKGDTLPFYLSLIAMALTSPVIAGSGSSVIPGLLATTFAMIFFMIYYFELIVRKKHSMSGSTKKWLIWIFFLFAFMMLGEFLGTVLNYAFPVSWSVYAAGMSVSMFLYFYMNFLPATEKMKRSGWARDRKFLFMILLLAFVSEWFAGAALSFAVPGYPAPGHRGFRTFSDALGGVNVFTPASSIFDSVFLIGSVANGSWFLMIMGLEMGSLVILRTRKEQWREKRVNLYLALAAFALYTLYYPNFGNSHLFEVLPFWANVGALDSLFPYMLFALAGSYALFAVLALLFGRRSYCSTLCPSAMMYGGTLGQSMISFNYESKISRKHIGSRYRKSLYPVIYNSWILIIVAAAISYIGYGGTYISLWGVDVSVFYSYFVWNTLWYIFFISIPFVGMSPCRRYGWCTTGTFVGFFSRIGLFRLKVHNPQTCVTCPDKPCVSACEVGLGDLPAQFIKTGEFRSSKCVGAGSCVIACPYDNIYFYDIRTLLKERKKLKREN